MRPASKLKAAHANYGNPTTGKALSFFQSTEILKIRSQVFEKTAAFCGKLVQKVPNLALFRRASRK